MKTKGRGSKTNGEKNTLAAVLMEGTSTISKFVKTNFVRESDVDLL